MTNLLPQGKDFITLQQCMPVYMCMHLRGKCISLVHVCACVTAWCVHERLSTSGCLCVYEILSAPEYQELERTWSRTTYFRKYVISILCVEYVLV